MRIKNIALIVLGIIFLWFLYSIRSILIPFIVAGIFAYIFNPIVSFFYSKFKLPKSITIFSLYFLIVILVTAIGIIVARQLSIESLDFNSIIQSNLKIAKIETAHLPAFIKPIVTDLISSFSHSRFLAFFQAPYKSIAFSRAISGVVDFIIFIFAGFYFLKDGEDNVRKLLTLFSKNIRSDIENLITKINLVLVDYLRGEILLIFLVSLILYIALLIVGEKFALMIAIFSGFAEIIPVVGPITAGAVAVIIMLLTGNNNFGLNPLDASIIIVLIYLLLRQLEDYLVIPHVMAKITKLNPLLIFFAVIAGGRLAGILGLILAVPITAILRVLIVFFLEKNPLGKE